MNKRPTRSADPEGGRVPPQAVDVEKMVLGAMLISSEAVPKVLESLTPDMFYAPNHQRYYAAMMAVFESSKAVDVVTVTEELRKSDKFNGMEDPIALTEFTMVVSSAANVEFHAEIVLEYALRRRAIQTMTELVSQAYSNEDTSAELLDRAEERIFQIAERRARRAFKSAREIVEGTLESLQAIHGVDGGVTGVPSGFDRLDERTGGFQKADLIIVAGRPSQGKTALALAIARNAALHKTKAVPVGMFSLEMSEQQLMLRLMAAEARVSAHRLRTGQLHEDGWRQLTPAVKKIGEAPIYVDDTAAIGILELRSKARRLKAEVDIGLLIVDYLQLVVGPKNSESREREISFISRSLKALAKELNVPVIALSQLNRAVESRQDKRPVLADLRESGAIEQDSDVVLFVHRPETYGIQTVTMEDGVSQSAEGIGEVIIGKQRNGPVGSVFVAFRKEYAGFQRLAPASMETMVPAPAQPDFDRGGW